MFSGEFCQIFLNTFFMEHPRTIKMLIEKRSQDLIWTIGFAWKAKRCTVVSLFSSLFSVLSPSFLEFHLKTESIFY